MYLTWRAEEYIITNRRVLKVEGLLDKKSGDSSLDKINDAVLKQGLLARMLHYGDLEILTAQRRCDRPLRDARPCGRLQEGDAERQERPRGRLPRVGRQPKLGRCRAGSRRSTPVGKSSSSDDVTATLAKLADLRDKGAITPADYEAKKAELLGRL